MSTFDEFVQKPVSEKVVLFWVFPKERIITAWNDEGGGVYSTPTEFWVHQVREDGVVLTDGGSPSLLAGQFYYDSDNSIVYVHTSGSVDPGTVFISFDYKLFYSNRPSNLPHDLSAGRDIHYDGLIQNISKFSTQIDNDDLTGIALSGNGTVTLNNNSGIFEDLYDRLFWEGADVELYIWSPELNNATEAQIIYRGKVDSKAYTEKDFKLKVKDFVDELRNEVPLPSWTTSDGLIPDSILGKPKRRLYGQNDGVRTIATDQILDGYRIQGSWAGQAGNNFVTGSGFISSVPLFVYQNDQVWYTNSSGDETLLTVDYVDLPNIYLTEELSEDIPGRSLRVRPEVPIKFLNRSQNICHHALKQPTVTITSVDSANRFNVDSTTDFEAGDKVSINGETRILRRISGLTMVLETNLSAVPSVSDDVLKNSVQEVFIGTRELVASRDFTFVNSGSGSRVELEELAEFNIAPVLFAQGSWTFTNGSNTVTAVGGDFENKIRPKDWIKPDLTSKWYEVIRVIDDNTLEIFGNFTGVTTTTTAKKKRPEYVSDETIVTVNCLGITEDNNFSSEWINKGAHIVRHLLEEQGLTDRLETSNFDQAKLDAPYMMSMKLPFDFLGNRPRVRDVIDAVNKSVFGSLHNNADYNIVYNVMSPKKPAISETIKDDDIVSYSIASSGKNITRSIVSNYRHFDFNPVAQQEKGSFTLEFTNSFIDMISDITREEVLDLYLYKDNEVNILTQRTALLRETSNLVLKLRTKMNFMNRSVNDLVYFELDRLFTRFGTVGDKNRVGIITGISKGDTEAIITVTDLSGMYNKVCTYTSAAANIYSDTDKIDRARDGFYTDTNETVNDINKTYRINLYG